MDSMPSRSARPRITRRCSTATAARTRAGWARTRPCRDSTPRSARGAWKPEAAVCVNLVSGGYPGRYPTGLTIAGVESVALDGVQVFHAGTAERDGRLVTAGGRVLGVTANGRDVRDAMARAY